jgi:hypothetical protein
MNADKKHTQINADGLEGNPAATRRVKCHFYNYLRLSALLTHLRSSAVKNSYG